MLRLLTVLAGIAAGVAAGLVATAAALHGAPPFGAVRVGAWAAWPSAGTAAADPYERAIAARDGRVPLATAGGLRFTASTDEDGRTLDGRCSYGLAGAGPPAEHWSLTVLNTRGDLRTATPARQGLTSAELIRDGDGTFAITVSRQARPGNWLPTPGDDPFLLMLSLYDTPLSAGPGTGAAQPALPSIVREDCP